MAINAVTLALWIAGFLILVGIATFIFHFIKEKNNRNNGRMQNMPYNAPLGYPQQQNVPQFQAYNPSQNPIYPPSEMPTTKKPIQQQVCNPYLEGSSEWYAFEMVMAKKCIQDNPVNDINLKLVKMEQKNAILINNLMQKISEIQTPKEQYTIKATQKESPLIVVEKQDISTDDNKTIIADSEIEQSEEQIGKSIEGNVKIIIPLDEMIDESAKDIIKTHFDEIIKRNLTILKKDIKKLQLQSEISYTID